MLKSTQIFNMTEIPAQSSSLVSGFKSQDPNALQSVLEWALDEGRRWSRRTGLPPDEVDDVVQETILSLLRRASSETGLPESIQSDGQFKNFLFAALRNRLLERYRSSRRSELNPKLLEVADLRESPEARFSNIEVQDQLRRALEKLSALEREIIRLRYVEDMPTADIAVMLGISQGSVRVKVYRALAHVRALIGAIGSEKP